MAFTLNEIALLLVALGIGLVIGLMISGRGKYKRLWREEQMAHRQTIRDSDARAAATPVGGAAPARAGEHDDLSRIRGISTNDAAALHEAGYHNYRQIGAMSEEQQAALEARLGREPGTMQREEWRTQARLLETGKVREHERRYLPTS